MNAKTTPLPAVNPPKGALLSGPTYDRLKRFNQLVLPSFATLYAALAILWGFPGGEKVVGSIAALTVFIGVLLTWASSRYDASDEKYDGAMLVNPDPEVPNSLEFHVPVDQLATQREITLRVVEV